MFLLYFEHMVWNIEAETLKILCWIKDYLEADTVLWL